MDGVCLRFEGDGNQREAGPITPEVRQARASDREGIERFLDEAYEGRSRYKTGDRWTWQFQKNPFASQRDDRVPVWIAVSDGRVVGQIAVQEAELMVEGQTFSGGWILDVMVLPSHRGAGLGHRLYEAVAKDVPVLVTLTMAEATRKMGERLGAITVGDVPQFTRWVQLDPETVRRYLMVRTETHRRARLMAQIGCDLGQFHRLLPRAVNPALRLADRTRRAPTPPGTATIVEVDAFDSRMDELSRTTRGDYPVIFPRDARFLNWRFRECPDLRYRCFIAERAKVVVGYVVLRDPHPAELPEGHIVDLYAARADASTIDQLLRHSLRFFGDRVVAVDTGTSVPEIQSALRRYGFFRTRTHRPTCVCQDDAVRRRLTQLKDVWYLSKGDHDWDQIHVVEESGGSRS